MQLHEKILVKLHTLYFFKLGKMSNSLLSAAVVMVALRVIIILNIVDSLWSGD